MKMVELGFLCCFHVETVQTTVLCIAVSTAGRQAIAVLRSGSIEAVKMLCCKMVELGLLVCMLFML